MRQQLLLVMLLVGSFMLTGCGGGTSGEGEATSSPESGPEVKHITSDKLKPLGDVMPPLDGGKILISPPKDWYTLGRNAAYVAAFSHAKGSQLPLITVKAADPKVTGFDNVTAENVVEYAAAVQESLVKQFGDRFDVNVAEPAKPMKIGDNAFARYVKNAKNSSRVDLHVQVLETIRGGRSYSVELQVVKGAIVSDRDVAYAVAGGLKFEAGSTPAAPEGEKKEEAEPAKKEEAPAAEEPAKKQE